MTQIDLGLRLGRTQNYVSTAERGAVRLDGLRLRDWCQAGGTDLVNWAHEIESQLSVSGKLPGIKLTHRRSDPHAQLASALNGKTTIAHSSCVASVRSAS